MKKNDFENAIQNVLNDNISGSQSIVNEVIQLSESYVLSNEFEALFLIENYLQVYSKFPQFAVLFHFLNEAFLELSKLQQANYNQFDFHNFIQQYLAHYKNVNADIFRYLIEKEDFKSKSIFLHSNSCTIKEVVTEISKTQEIKEIIQTISYPAKEGVKQAEFFAGMNINVNLIPDAAIFRFVKLSDIVLLGADTIFEEFFINKTGTQSIVVAANYFNKPVYVLADSRKIIPHHKLSPTLIKAFLNEHEKPGSELLEKSNENIVPLNYYFEKTPSNLVSAFITEDGFFKAENLYSNLKDVEISELLLGI